MSLCSSPGRTFYAEGHPGPEDVFLVVEGIETSSEYDRDVKVPLYARFGTREVWLVDLQAECVEVYREPSSTGYTKKSVHKPGELLSPEAFPGFSVPLDEILIR